MSVLQKTIRAFKHRRDTGASQYRSLKEKRKGECCILLISSHYFSIIREGERERLRERLRERTERERERD